MIGFTTFHLILYSIDLTRKATRITNDPVDLSTILPEYHEFADIFSKAKVKTLAPHCSHDLQIKLENRKKPSIRTIYLLSVSEQEALKEFIYENLNTGFI